MDESSLVIAIRFADQRVRAIGTLQPPDEGPWLLTSESNAPRDAGVRSLERHRLRRLQDVAQPLVLFFLSCVAWLIWFRERSQYPVFWLALLLTAEAATRFFAFAQVAIDTTPFRYPTLRSAFGVPIPTALLAQLIWSLVSPPRWLLGLVWISLAIGAFTPEPVTWTAYRWDSKWHRCSPSRASPGA